MAAVTVTLLTRPGCGLCRSALQQLQSLCAEFDIVPQVVDVDVAAEQDPDSALAAGRSLRAEFGDRLPVVLLDGREHSYFEVDEPRLRADLHARR
jgi:glutaredoxin